MFTFFFIIAIFIIGPICHDLICFYEGVSLLFVHASLHFVCLCSFKKSKNSLVSGCINPGQRKSLLCLVELCSIRKPPKPDLPLITTAMNEKGFGGGGGGGAAIG